MTQDRVEQIREHFERAWKQFSGFQGGDEDDDCTLRIVCEGRECCLQNAPWGNMIIMDNVTVGGVNCDAEFSIRYIHDEDAVIYLSGKGSLILGLDSIESIEVEYTRLADDDEYDELSLMDGWSVRFNEEGEE